MLELPSLEVTYKVENILELKLIWHFFFTLICFVYVSTFAFRIDSKTDNDKYRDN